MKLLKILIIGLVISINCNGMNRPNPGCLRSNSDGVRAAMFLMYLAGGEIKPALDLLDKEAYENIGEKPLKNAAQAAKDKYAIDVRPILEQVELLKKQKLQNEAPIPDLPD